MSCQVMADMKKVYDDLTIINLYCAGWSHVLVISFIFLGFTKVYFSLVNPFKYKRNAIFLSNHSEEVQ